MFDNNATFALLTASTDLGETFSSPVDISAQVKRPSWGFWAPTLKGIQLVHHPEHAGRLVVSADFVPYQPGHVPFCYPIDKGQSYAILSDDGGEHWRPGGANPMLTTNECAIAELHDGTLVMNARNYLACPGPPHNSCGAHASAHSRRAISYSTDAGESWNASRLAEDLPGPVCQGDMISVADGTELLFVNPHSTSARANLTLHCSKDGGRHWQPILTLQPGPSSYSNLVELGTGQVGVAWVEAVDNVINPPPGGADIHCRPTPHVDVETPLACQRIVFALLKRGSKYELDDKVASYVQPTIHTF